MTTGGLAEPATPEGSLALPPADGPTRGTLVMLVDNGVDGDSRVQKAARSAADAGWDVVLLGKSPDDQTHTWQLGRARVRLIPTPVSAARLRRRVTGAVGRRAPALDRAYASVSRRVLGNRAWRALEPGLWDFEHAFGPVIDSLRPDLIYAHDFRMIGVGARAKSRAQRAGRTVPLIWDAHEFVPGIHPWQDNARWLPAHMAYELEYSRFADAVVTVSPTLAELLRERHALTVTPEVVLNAPMSTDALASGTGAPDIRAACGIGPDVPLVVYSGMVAERRGLAVMVEALAHIDDMHVGFVINKPDSPFVAQLRARAAELGAADRLHILPYVKHDQVVGYLSGADVGVIPIHHWPNHEIALITKFFEYAHARLPMVVSDVKTMADTTRAVGQGEVFRAEDVADYVRALRTVLADPARYRAAYGRPGLLSEWTWETQARVLERVYDRLLPVRVPAQRDASEPRTVPDVTIVIAVYNAMPYLNRCLDSLVGQTIGHDRMEIVAIDDGSTDDSGRVLDRYAARYPGLIRVVHQKNSGGPASPNNRALDLATGRFVFFVGADDYIGLDSMRRMVDEADRTGADVVACKMIGVNGRWVPTEVFRHNDDDIDLYNSTLPMALQNTKLFRRELIERHNMRYLQLKLGTDFPFTLEACVRAGRIAVLGDYDFYFAVRRHNDSNITYDTSVLDRLDCTEVLIRYALDLLPPGPKRDAISHRFLAWELTNMLDPQFLRLPPAVQDELAGRIGRLAGELLTDAITPKLEVSARLRLTLARLRRFDDLRTVIRQLDANVDAPLVVDGDRIYLGYAGFRDPAFGLGDDVYQVSGSPAETVAIRMAVTAAGWDRVPAGPRFAVTVHSPVPLGDGSAVAVRASLAGVPGEVALEPDGAGGSVVRVAIPLQRILAAVPVGGRHDLRVVLEAAGTRAEKPVRLPSTVTRPHKIGRLGHTLYRAGAGKDRNGNLVLDIVPVSTQKVMGRVTKILRQRKNARADGGAKDVRASADGKKRS